MCQETGGLMWQKLIFVAGALQIGAFNGRQQPVDPLAASITASRCL